MGTQSTWGTANATHRRDGPLSHTTSIKPQEQRLEALHSLATDVVVQTTGATPVPAGAPSHITAVLASHWRSVHSSRAPCAATEGPKGPAVRLYRSSRAVLPAADDDRQPSGGGCGCGAASIAL